MGKKDFTVVFEDNEIVILNKSAGLLSIPDRYNQDIRNLKTALMESREQVFVVHRLDRDTSGLICFAKTENAQRSLSQQFEKRTADKWYTAIVSGQLRDDEGTIESGIAESSVRGKYKVDKTGKLSKTEYKIIERFKNYSYVKYKLITGRTHQIRVHSTHIGHPIVGDYKYNQNPDFLISTIKKKKFNLKKGEEERSLIDRHLLHAATLSIVHPTTEETMSFEADIPKDMRAVLNQLRKWNVFKDLF